MNGLTWLQRFLAAFLGLAVCLCTQGAFANTKFDNNDIYEVVIESDGPDKEAPGVYRINKKTGDSELILSGQLMGVNRAQKGIRAYSIVGRQTAQDAFVIIDGKLTLLNYNTKDGNPKTYVQVGTDKSVPLVDILSGRSVVIPPIQSNDDINIYEARTYLHMAKAPRGAQLFFFSIRAPSIMGSGLTFALMVDASDVKSVPSLTHNKAFLLSYDFLDQAQLRRLLPGNGDEPLIYAPLLLESTVSQIQELSSEMAIANRWKNHVLNFIRYLQDGKLQGGSAKAETATALGLPRFNLANGMATQSDVPVEFIYAGRENKSMVASQFFDLYSRRFYLLNPSAGYKALAAQNGSNHLAFLKKEEALSQVIMDGTIQRTKSGNFQIFGTSSVSTYPKTDVLENFDRNILIADQDGYGKIIILAENLEGKPFILPIGRKIAPDAKMSMVEKMYRIQNGEKTFRVFFLNTMGKAKGQVEILILENVGSTFNLVAHKTIYQGPSMSTEEMSARIWHVEGADSDLLFDNITPVKGYAAYVKSAGEKGKEIEEQERKPKTVPYLRVLNETPAYPGLRVSQKYVQPIFKRDLPDGLSYQYYDATGAKIVKSGFYLNKNGTEAERGEPLFLLGRPLYSKRSKDKNGGEEINHISDRQEIFFPLHDDGHLMMGTMRLFPHTDQLKFEKGRELDVRTFQMGISLTGAHLTGDMVKLDIPQPFKTLAFTKIISGTKKRADEVHILFGFRKDPSVNNSQDVLLVATAHISSEKGGAGLVRAKLNFGAPRLLHRGAINPTDLVTYLRVDAEGNYYWVADPAQAPDSVRYVVKQLSNPETNANSRRGGVGLLREPEDFKATQLGHGGKRFAGGGLWEVLNEYTLKERVIGASNVIEALQKLKKGGTKDGGSKSKTSEKEDKEDSKEPAPTIQVDASEKMLFESFDAHLNTMAQKTGSDTAKVQVILVESSMKEKFRTRMITNLVGEKGGKFSVKNPRFHFYYADASLDDVEVGQEFLSLHSTDKGDGKVLFVEPELLKTSNIKVKNPEEQENEQEEDVDFLFGAAGARRKAMQDKDQQIFKFDELTAPANMAVILATGGGAKSLKGFEKVKKAHQHEKAPSFIIATPEEWREILANNEHEADAGVFNEFEMNYDYLTAPWTMWPPNTAKASDEIKEVGKAPYNQEEMKVFPSLERFINQAASGELRGKQKIVIVPPELLPIVNKLMLLRWSSNDFNASMPWSYGNRGMAFFKLNTKDVSQSSVQDNFKAIRGASNSRNAVLYGDLETVMRFGRPINSSGRNFTLRDPLKTNDSFILERDAENFMARQEDGQVRRAPVELDEESQSKIEELQALVTALDTEIGQLQESIDALEDSYDSARERKDEERRIRKEIAEKESDRRSFLGEIAQIEQGPEYGGSDANDQKLYPHMMWHIAAEGQQVQPKKGKEWNLAEAAPRTAATILIGTEDQLAQLEADLAFESKFFNLREHFEVEKLQTPDIATKVALVEQLFNRPEISALGINFKLSNGEITRDAREQLIFQFVNRVDQLAYDQRLEKTTAFVRAFIALRQSLTEDLDLRRSRLIDEKYVERLFTRVFPMALNPKILPDSDPLNQISNLDQASRNLQKSGYEGSQDLKRRFFETILSQTRNTDTSRPIPNSQIVFGSTSTGKTFLLETYFKMVGMTEYQMNKPNNENADYIIIKVGDLTDDSKTEPSKTPVDAMIANVLDLLSQPKGSRAYIVIDDFHKATSTEVRQKLFRFIMGIFDARKGMFPVQSKDGRRNREIPIQNLNIAMTLNPTSNEKMRREYVTPGTEYTPIELLKREVLAAMSDDKFKPEESELARWSDIINMDKFPRSAKVPELGKRVREYSRSNSSMMLVDPLVIDALVEKFAQANARELLAPAAAALTNVPHAARASRVYTLSLRKQKMVGDSDGIDRGQLDVGLDHKGRVEQSISQVNLNELQGAVREITQVDPVLLSEPGSMVRFISFIFQNFRLQVFNAMAIEAHMGDDLRLERPGMASVLKSNFLIGSASHVLDHPILPMNELEIRQDQLSYFNRTQQEEFYKEVRDSNREEYFPDGFSSRRKDSGLELDRFIQGGWGSMEAGRTRKDVIHEFVGRAQKILQKAAVIYLRLQSEEQLHGLSQWNEAQIRNWFDLLKEQNPDGEFKAVMVELINLFLDFGVEFNAQDLVENAGGESTLTIYDQVRFFNYILDKAMTELPWGGMAKMAYDVVDLSSDFSLGARTAYKEYVGVHAISPFAITTPEFMNEMLEIGFDTGVKTEVKERQKRLGTLNAGFKSACELLLKGK